MKKSQLLFFLFAFAFFVTPTYAVPNAPKPVEKEAITAKPVSAEEMAKQQAATAKEEWNNLSRKEKKAKRKEMKKNLKSALKTAKEDANSDLDLTLLIILAVLIPPLAMGLYDGISKRFWISLLLTLLFYVPGLIYTLVVILREN